jgi:hypothetical protein
VSKVAFFNALAFLLAYAVNVLAGKHINVAVVANLFSLFGLISGRFMEPEPQEAASFFGGRGFGRF